MDTNSLLNMNLALNVARKCRICGMDILDLSCAFSIFGSDRLDHKLERYLRLNIQADDLMPKCICGSCYLKLESIDQFALMANRTEEAFRTWIRRLRGLNCPDDSIQNVNLVLPLFRPQQTAYANDCTTEQKIHVRSFQSKEAKEQPHQQHPSIHPVTPKLSPAGSSGQANPPETTVISYSDLKLGLLIKDQELLKLILKALKWAENDRQASFEVLIQRLKNSSFREILSNHHLLNDSDLTQLLKSYIGQGVMNIFSTPSPSTTVTNNNVPPLVLSSSIVSQTAGIGVTLTNEILESINRIKQPTALSNTTPLSTQCTISNRGNGSGFKLDEASERMEVGVDPDLYFPYDDEDSSSANKFDHRFDERQDNTVTIKLVPTSGDSAECRKMIPAILNVRSSNRFQCSMCPECFPSNNDLQQHTVLRHLPTTHPTVMTEHGKPAIKIRVRKNKATTLPSDRLLPKLSNITSIVTSEQAPATESMTIAPLKIPASTTITVIPGCAKPPPMPSPPGTSVITANPNTTKARKRLLEPPSKIELIRKSKRKPVPKVKHSPSPVPCEKKTNRSVRKSIEPELVVATKVSSRRRTPSAFCTVCRTKLAARETIRQHMEQQHSRFECENCGRTFKSKLSLVRHQQQHHVASTIAPGNASKSELQTQRTSKGKKLEDSPLHKCTQCSKAFRKAVHLKVHVLNHSSEEAKRVAEPKVTIVKATTVLRKRTILVGAKTGNSNPTPVGRTKRNSKMAKK
ncbi:uncharacterized protein LOC125949628 [Anopheles darlingi]|uniref:uncharacterized protein LOC125949628 n=1 Tax=Anopheles darlingi TaxID=43151 RepID=UPI00210060AD|nr:uncharacterized protein LOC125949628 [Anopheles darlingi]XP_049532818.1 uncharacterized protein LOC125949628 [Anopheles darlingi]XP_049532819.1 uncharacterized protein LOC125949628 [Anopheles darlingi]